MAATLSAGVQSLVETLKRNHKAAVSRSEASTEQLRTGGCFSLRHSCLVERRRCYDSPSVAPPTTLDRFTDFEHALKLVQDREADIASLTRSYSDRQTELRRALEEVGGRVSGERAHVHASCSL